MYQHLLPSEFPCENLPASRIYTQGHIHIFRWDGVRVAPEEAISTTSIKEGKGVPLGSGWETELRNANKNCKRLYYPKRIRKVCLWLSIIFPASKTSIGEQILKRTDGLLSCSLYQDFTVAWRFFPIIWFYSYLESRTHQLWGRWADHLLLLDGYGLLGLI